MGLFHFAEWFGGLPPQYPTEARQEYLRARYDHRDKVSTLLDEARTCRLLMRTSGRRVADIYRQDLKGVQMDMALERAAWAKARVLL